MPLPIKGIVVCLMASLEKRSARDQIRSLLLGSNRHKKNSGLHSSEISLTLFSGFVTGLCLTALREMVLQQLTSTRALPNAAQVIQVARHDCLQDALGGGAA
jgi:hypothetical protein